MYCNMQKALRFKHTGKLKSGPMYAACKAQLAVVQLNSFLFGIFALCVHCPASFLLAAFGLSYLSPLVNLLGSVHLQRQVR